MQTEPWVLVVEDGHEYYQNLTRFVDGPCYLQVHTGAAALSALAEHQVDVVYLDMRFDRIERSQLLGDMGDLARRLGGSQERALRHLQNHQGLYILEAMRGAGYGHLPVILAYDFSHERERFAHLSRQHPNLTWVPDAITPEEIRGRIMRLSGR